MPAKRSTIFSCIAFLALIELGACDDPYRFIPYASPFARTIQRRVHPFHPIRDHLVPFVVTSPPTSPPLQPSKSQQLEPNATTHLPNIATNATKANISIEPVNRHGTSTQSNYDAAQTILQANTKSNYDVHSTGDSHRFESSDFWNIDDRPVLANGHIGFVPFGDSIFMNGLYNGATPKSHRARIPNYANIQVELCSRQRTNDIDAANESNKLAQCTYTLDTFNGVFSSRVNEGCFSIEHIQYAHRYHHTAMINRIRIQRCSNDTNDGRANVFLSLSFTPIFWRFSNI